MRARGRMDRHDEGKARRALATKKLLVRATFFFQYTMDFIERAFVCALRLRIRKDRRQKRHWVHPVVSKILLNGQFYKLSGIPVTRYGNV
jgi:hypothetical protein